MIFRLATSLLLSLLGVAAVLTALHAVTGDVSWWQDDVWIKTWLGIGVLTAIPTGARSNN